MNLLLKRNYSNFDVNDQSEELVSVKTLDGTDWEHILFDGFLPYSHFLMLNLPIRKVACSGYRESFNDPWQYLKKDQYAVGVLLNKRIYVIEKFGEPLLGRDSELCEVKRDKKNNVVKLFG